VNNCDILCSDNSSAPFPQRLIEAVGRLQTQTITPLGSVYVYDLIEQRTLSASCSIAAMLGYTADEIDRMGAIGLASLIHPHDLNRVSEHYQRFTSLQSGEVITVNYRMRRADKTWCWLRSEETPLVSAIDGFPLQLLGIVQVMTRRSTTNPGKLVLSRKLFGSRVRLSRRQTPLPQQTRKPRQSVIRFTLSSIDYLPLN
jgi:hypothetical protein